MTAAIDFTRRVFERALTYLRGDAKLYGVALSLLIVLSVLVDTQLPMSLRPISNVAVGGLTTYVQLLITFRMLNANGAGPPGYTLAGNTEARLPSMLVAGILETVAVLLGLLLCVVPGVLLMLLWSLTMPALAAERLGASAALARSWGLARHSLGALALVGSVFVLAVFAIVVAMVGATYFAPRAPWLETLITDVPLPAVILASSAVWAAAYLELRGSGPASV